MVTGWRFLAVAGGIFLVTVIVVRGILAVLAHRAIRNGSISEHWLHAHRSDTRPD